MSNIPSFEEKSAWVQMIAVLITMGAYFSTAIPMMTNGQQDLPDYIPAFGSAVAALIVIMIVGHILAVMVGGAEDADERDHLIAWKAESRSSWIMGLGSFAAMTALLVNVENVWVAHILLLSLYLSEILKNSLQIIAYRRGS